MKRQPSAGMPTWRRPTPSIARIQLAQEQRAAPGTWRPWPINERRRTLTGPHVRVDPHVPPQPGRRFRGFTPTNSQPICPRAAAAVGRPPSASDCTGPLGLPLEARPPPAPWFLKGVVEALAIELGIALEVGDGTTPTHPLVESAPSGAFGRSSSLDGACRRRASAKCTPTVAKPLQDQGRPGDLLPRDRSGRACWARANGAAYVGTSNDRATDRAFSVAFEVPPDGLRSRGRSCPRVAGRGARLGSSASGSARPMSSCYLATDAVRDGASPSSSPTRMQTTSVRPKRSMKRPRPSSEGSNASTAVAA